MSDLHWATWADNTPEPDCLDEHLGDCDGPVEHHMLPGAERAFPRCEKHWARRLEQDEKHRADYPDSPFPPAWFDPMDAGERWDDDY